MPTNKYCEAVRMFVIDAAKVIGSRPTGWWRDRPGAARRFTERARATERAAALDGLVEPNG